MAIYPVSIKGQNTLYIRATKAEITGEMRRLGVKNFTIQNAVPKNMLSKINITSLLNVKKLAPFVKGKGLGKGASGPNNPGMKPDLEAQSKLKKKEPSNKRGGSGNQTKKNVKPPVNKKTVGNKQTLNQKISELAKKVKRKTPNVNMGKITDTIRGMIRKKPLTAVAGAGGLGIAIGAIIASLQPTRTATDKQMREEGLKINKKSGVPLGPNRPKSKTKDKNGKGAKPKSRPKSRITKPSGIGVTIITPVSKPKRDNGKSKKKTDKGGSGMMLSLIVGGKGTTADRMKEIKAEKTLEKKLGRRPSKKELVSYLKKN